VIIWKDHGTEAAPVMQSGRGGLTRGADTLRRLGGWISQHDAGRVVVGGLTLWLAIASLRLWIARPLPPVGLPLVLLGLLQGSLFLVRRRDTGAARPLAIWAAASIGSWAFLLARPIGAGYFDSRLLFDGNPLFGTDWPWLGLQAAGAVLAIVSLSSLGRSFGLLAANRGVRTGGAYRIVRHPAYASYFIVQGAYVLENFTLWNLLLFAVVVIAQLRRITQEEAFLSDDPAYQGYCERVHYRLVPGIY